MFPETRLQLFATRQQDAGGFRELSLPLETKRTDYLFPVTIHVHLWYA